MFTYTEREVIKELYKLGNGHHVLVKSKLAIRLGITNSIVVNTTKKLEIAGAIRCKSLGMKGSVIMIDDVELLTKYL